MESNYEKAFLLVKESTSYIDSDINKAIELIEQAIEINSEVFFEHYSKLARYYQIKGDSLKGISILHDLQNEYPIELYFNKAYLHSEIYSEISKINWKDGLIYDYIFNHSISRYYVILFKFMRTNEILELREFNPSELFGISMFVKINSAFKKIKRIGSINEFANKFGEFFLERLNYFSSIHMEVILAEQYSNKNPSMEVGYLNTQRNFLNTSKNFQSALERVSQIKFEAYYKESLLPLIL